MKKSTKMLLLIVCAVVFVILIISLSMLLPTKKSPTWQEQYDLGVRYLSEGNYQEAIIAFTAAIEIDTMRPEAYLKAAEAYEATGDGEAARAILERGYAATGDESLKPQKGTPIPEENLMDISTDGEFYGREPYFDFNYGASNDGKIFTTSTGTYLIDNYSLYRENESGFEEIQLLDCNPLLNDIAVSGNWLYYIEQSLAGDEKFYLARYNFFTKEKEQFFEHTHNGWITVYKDHVYFLELSSKNYTNDTCEFWRCKLDGSQKEMLMEMHYDVDNYIDFYDDNLYLIRDEIGNENLSGLWQVSLDGRTQKLVVPSQSLSSFSISNSRIYFLGYNRTDINDGYSVMYSCNLDGTDFEPLFQEGDENEISASIYGFHPTSNGIYYYAHNYIRSEGRDFIPPVYFKFWSVTNEIKNYGLGKDFFGTEIYLGTFLESERYLYFYKDMWQKGAWYDEDYTYGSIYIRFDKLSGKIDEISLPHEYYWEYD